MKRPRWQNDRRARPARRWLRRPRVLRAALWLASGALGFLAGAFRGEDALAHLFPERAARVRFAVMGNVHASAAELAAATAVVSGTPLRTLDLDAVRTRLAGHPWVRRARIATFPPDRLILGVEEREPVAVVRLAGVARLVDRDGTSFARASEDARLPELRGAGTPGGPPLVEGVALLAALEAEGLQAPRALILGGDTAAKLPALELGSEAKAPGARVLLGRDDQARKLARLAELLAANPPELASTAEIDLRFGADVILRPRAEAAAADAAGAGPRIANGASKARKTGRRS